MIKTLAIQYVRALLILNLALLVLALLFHAFVLVGYDRRFTGYGMLLFGATIVAAIATGAFQRNWRFWSIEIKCCPPWARWAMIGIVCYILSAYFVADILRSINNYSIQMTLSLSEFSMGVSALSACIAYAAGWKHTLNNSAIQRRAAYSILSTALSGLIFIKYVGHVWN